MKLKLDNIHKQFDQKEVLKGSSFIFEDSKIYGILGRNGSGKTTLFNIMYHELEADDGTITLEKDGLTKALEPQDVAMVFAENYLPDFMTGYEFILFYIDVQGDENSLTPDEYLDLVGIDEKDRHRLIKGYSSGMQSKLSLLTMFISQPPVILLDEPLTAVDVISGIEIKELLLTLKPGRVILLSTHILQLAEDLCDEIVLLKNGQLSSLDDFETEAAFEARIVEALGDHDADA